MKIVAYLNIISPHQLPLARALSELVGADEYRYLYCRDFSQERAELGWCKDGLPDWCLPVRGNELLLEDAELVYVGGIRPIEFLEKRWREDKKTVYMTERWFKPLYGLPGWVRLFNPSYFHMAKRFVNWLNKDPNAKCLAIGPWAAKDMRLIGIRPEKIVPWGYFVEPSTLGGIPQHSEDVGLTRVLWIGRMLRLKRVDDILRAVKVCVTKGKRIVFDVYGSGAEERKLKRLTAQLGLEATVKFHSPVPITEVRALMHGHDVYVFSSNSYDGWGAVVSEALEEGMKVVGTYEAGASAAILPKTNLYHAGDWRRLAQILQGDIAHVPIGEWTAMHAAKKLMEFL